LSVFFSFKKASFGFLKRKNMTIKEVKAAIPTATKPVVKLFRKTNDAKLIIIGLKQNIKLKEHTTPVPAKLTVLEGCVKYIQGEETIMLNQYDEQEIPVQIVHALEAVEDSICLLIQG